MTDLAKAVKLSLRIVADDFDSEIENDVSAAILDMKRVGIAEPDTTDAIIIRLCELYTKAAFNFEQDGERYQKAYEYMRDGVSLSGDYMEEA